MRERCSKTAGKVELSVKLFINLMATLPSTATKMSRGSGVSAKLSKAHQTRQFERVAPLSQLLFLVLQARTGRYLRWRHVAPPAAADTVVPGLRHKLSRRPQKKIHKIKLGRSNTEGGASQMFWESTQGCVRIKWINLRGHITDSDDGVGRSVLSCMRIKTWSLFPLTSVSYQKCLYSVLPATVRYSLSFGKEPSTF